MRRAHRVRFSVVLLNGAPLVKQDKTCTIYLGKEAGNENPINGSVVVKNSESLFHRSFVFVFVVIYGLIMAGCQQSTKTEDQSVLSSKKIFYPAAPDKPRLQFLKSISGQSDLGVTEKKYSALEKLIAGDEEQTGQEVISKPYGLALYEGRLYVCDVQKKQVKELDLEGKTFLPLANERRILNPVNICIEKDRKYVADPIAGKVFAFNKNNELTAILGGDLKLKPIDVAVRGKRCYITDMRSNQVVVLDINSGEEIMRIGEPGDGIGQFGLIGDIALDLEENVYVTDKALGRVVKFDRNGVFKKTIGKVGDSIHDFVRPKGIDVDKEGRIWVVDAATEVGKVYNPEGQLLMIFGFSGGEPGNINLPASITIDYDNVDLFKEYFAKGAQIEFLVLVSSQYGEKINIYGFGSFPLQEEAIEKNKTDFELMLEPESGDRPG